jgi:hypothetical protein
MLAWHTGGKLLIQVPVDRDTRGSWGDADSKEWPRRRLRPNGAKESSRTI